MWGLRVGVGMWGMGGRGMGVGVREQGETTCKSNLCPLSYMYMYIDSLQYLVLLHGCIYMYMYM